MKIVQDIIFAVPKKRTQSREFFGAKMRWVAMNDVIAAKTEREAKKKLSGNIFPKILALCLIGLLVVIPIAPVFGEEMVMDSQPAEAESVADGADITMRTGAESNDIVESADSAINNSGSGDINDANNDFGGDGLVAVEQNLPSEISQPAEIQANDIYSGGTLTQNQPENIFSATTSIILEEATSCLFNLTASSNSNLLSEQSFKERIETELKSNCADLDEVGYYCLKDRLSADLIPSKKSFASGFKSFKDYNGGDKEIYFESSGGTFQITDNNYDDIFPNQDISGNRAVWQGQVGGRWQVFLASRKTRIDANINANERENLASDPSDISQDFKEENHINVRIADDNSSWIVSQITNSDSNNMNPQISGEYIVWQGWVDGNWEIFFAHRNPRIATNSATNGNEYNSGWNIKRITNNSYHDMFPKVGGGMITWQAFKDGVWQVFVYDIKTNTTSQITKGEGKYENPRLAIIWENRDSGGNIEMSGYDLSTGEAISFGEKNNKAKPIDIPDLPLGDSQIIISSSSIVIKEASSSAPDSNNE